MRKIPQLRVETEDGVLVGGVEEGVRVFRGVPYAQPPTGARRFGSPVPNEPWAGVREATRSGPASVQINQANTSRVMEIVRKIDPGVPGVMAWPDYTPKTYSQPHVDEDCLYLDIWVPEEGGEKPLPVYLYYHGGANVVSSGSFWLERGARLAREERVIVVRPNYRLGALGWVHFGLISDELPDAVNLGLQDQIAALRWVHRNIATFGGDPANITIGGESCGATAVSHLLCYPDTRPLIRRAVIQSLSPFNLWCTQRREEATEVAFQYLQLLEISDPAELRRLEPEYFLAVHNVLTRLFPADRNMAWRPMGAVVDGDLVPQVPAIYLSTARFPRVDFELMIGVAKDEWQFFRGHSETARRGSEPAVVDVFAQAFGRERARQLYNAYRTIYPDHTEPGHILDDVMSFEFFKFSSLLIADRLARQGVPVHLFQFSYDLPGIGGYLRAAHTGDMPFIWRNLDEADLRQWPSFDGADRSELEHIAVDFGRLYGAFLRDGDPGTAWPAFNPDGRTVLWVGHTVEPRPGLLDTELKAFKEAGVGDVAALEAKLVRNVRADLNVRRRATPYADRRAGADDER
jgi:para-nitrobenzyl esterase